MPPPSKPPPPVPTAGQVQPLDAGTFGAARDETGGGMFALGPETDHEAPGVSSQRKSKGDVCLYIVLLIATLGFAYLPWRAGRLTDDKK